MSLSSRLYGSTTFTPKKTEQDLLKESVQSVVKNRPVTPVAVKPLVKTEPKKTETKTVTKTNKKTPAYGTKGYISKDLPVRANPFMELANVAAFKLPENIIPGYKVALEQAKKESPIATTVAGMGGYLVPGVAGAKLVKPLLSKVGSKVVKNVTEGAIVGSGITAAENVVPLLKGDKDIKQVGKEIAYGAVTGAVADVGLYGLGKLAKPLLAKIAKGQTLSKAEKSIVAKQANVSVDNVDNVVNNYRKTIQEELGLPKDKTAQQYKAEIESQAYYDSFKKTPEKIVDEFQSWRSKNFGGATGKMPPKDIKALKELYLEDTGIDFDGEIAQAKQDFANKTGQGLPFITPKKPVDIVKPLLSDTVTPQQPIKQLIDVTPVKPTKPPKQESALAKALRIQEELQSGVKQPETSIVKTSEVKPVNEAVKKLDSDHQAELNRLKEIKARTTNKELIDSKIKAEGFRYAAERRRLMQGDSFEVVDGGLTPKELADKVKKEKTNYVGKTVVTPDGDGKVIGQSFGKIGVEFKDGTKKYFMDDEVQPKFKPYEVKTKVTEENIVKPQSEATVKPTTKVFEESDTVLGQTEKPFTTQQVKPKLETPEVDESTAKFYESAMKSEQVPETVKQRLSPIEERFKLPTTSNEARTKIADDFISKNKDDAIRLVKSGDKFESSVEPFIADRLIKSLTDEGRHDDVIDIIESMSRKSRSAGQDVQAMSIWSKATPEGMQRWTLRTLEEGNVKPEVARETAKQVGEDMRRLQKETSPEELAKLVASKIKSKPERNAFMSLMAQPENAEQIRALGVAKIQADALNKIAVGTGRKLATAQAISHLLNVKTFARNILGNVGSLTMEGISNVPANAFDSVVSLATGKKSVSSGIPKWQQGFAQGIKQGKQSTAEILLGVNKVQKDKYDLLMGSSFDKVPVLREAEKALSLSLNVPDEFFKGFAKANSLYDQVRARIGKEANNMTFDEILKVATPDEFQTAIDEAAYATFQNDSLPAKFLTKAKQTLNIIGIGKDSKTGLKEFGAGDLIIKYTRVPGNIIARAVDYSPAGAAKVAYYLTQVPNNPTMQRKAAQSFGRAFTGTSAMGLGYMLHKLGIMSADTETADPKEMALKRAEGVSGNKINASALKRYIGGGDPKPQKGDVYKDLAWLPINSALSVGANVSSNDGKPVDVLNTSGKTLEEVLDLPTLYTIKLMLYESQKEGATTTDILTVPVAEALPGFIPSPVRQLAQTIDPVIRETKGKDLSETTLNKIKANIPILSKKLEPRISPTGEVMKRTGGLLTTAITPSATTEYMPTGYTEKLQQLKKITDKSSQFPTSKAPNKIIYKKMDIQLTPQQKTEYMKLVGSYVDEKYSKMLSSKNINSLTPKEAQTLVDKLDAIKKDAAELAKRKIVRQQQY